MVSAYYENAYMKLHTRSERDKPSRQAGGAELYISRKTASVHLSRVMAKLGATNRTAAYCPKRSADLVGVAVDLPLQRRVQVKVAVLQEDALRGVDPAGVLVCLLLLHRPHARVQEGVEVRDFVTTL
jgi:hypothetical protein